MKKLLALALCILLLSGCAATYDGPRSEKTVISEFIQELHNPVTGHVDTKRTVYAYDIYGNIAQTLEYQNGEETAKTVFTYDDRGNLLKRTRYSLEGWFPRRSSQAEFTYDDQNRITAEIYADAKYEYIFDDEARTCTKLQNGGVIEETVYNAAGHKLSEKSWLNGGWHLIEYTWDSAGNPLTRHETDSEGHNYFVRYEYDEQGNTVFQEIDDNGQHKVLRVEYEYDSQGRPLRVFEVTDTSRSEKSRREYLDDNGSYTLWLGGLRSYTRMYDAEGNEIETIHYINKTDLVGIRKVSVYTQIQVPAKEETP